MNYKKLSAGVILAGIMLFQVPIADATNQTIAIKDLAIVSESGDAKMLASDNNISPWRWERRERRERRWRWRWRWRWRGEHGNGSNSSLSQPVIPSPQGAR